MKSTKVYTIGYAGMSLEQFKIILKKYRITDVVDVRSEPYSKRFVNYNIIPLSSFLKGEGVRYANWKEFGARQILMNYFTTAGYLDFEKYAKSMAFQTRLVDLLSGMKEKKVYLLLCAEMDPATCHRGIMIGRQLNDKGVSVTHLFRDGSYESQLWLEDNLIEHYFPNRLQLSMFESEVDKEGLKSEAYRLRNAQIGYRINTKYEEKHG